MLKRTASIITIFLLSLSLILPIKVLADDSTTIRMPDVNLKAAIKAEGDVTIKDMEKLTTLQINNKSIGSLEGLQYATNLQEIQLTGTGLKDIRIVGQLKSLNTVNLSSNYISDISPLASLTNITTLNLANNRIKSISSLQNLTMLNDLNLNNNQVTDLKPLTNLNNLDNLSLQENGLTDIGMLRILNKNNVFTTRDQIDLVNNELNLGAGSESAKIIDEIKANHAMVVWEPQQRIQLSINGQYINLSAAPVVINNRTMVPVRAIFENLGAKVQWNAKTRVVTGTKDSTNVVLTVNNKIAKVNGKNVILDVPATIVNNSVMVPTRFVAETFGKTVNWDPRTRSVIIE